MPEYVLGEFAEQIPRNAYLLDTGVLSEAYLGDKWHAEASYFLDNAGPILVPLCVVGEAWGVLVGKNGNRAGGIEMLRWVSTPGAAILIRDDENLARESETLCSKFKIDFVDAMLTLLADRLSRHHLNQTIQIATFDIRDFQKLKIAQTHLFDVYDVRSGGSW